MASSRHLGLGVIETRWFDDRHHTVRPLFEFLSYALRDRSDAFTYERFVGAKSFREAVRFIMAGGDIGYLYIAAHGDVGRIEAPNGSGMSPAFLRNTFCAANRRRAPLKGIMLGSCKFGDVDNLIELLRPARIRGEEVRNRLVWAGGYCQEIDYTRSSLLDVYFFDVFYRTNGGGDEVSRVGRALDRLDRTMPGLAESLPFRMVARLGRGRYRDLIQGVTLTD